MRADPPTDVKTPTSRERVIRAINFEPVDRVPVDLGGTSCSGAHVSVVAKLRQALSLDKPGDPVKVWDPHQMLGEIEEDLQNALRLDVINLRGPRNFFGFENNQWKKWKTFDETDVLVAGKFNTICEPNGDILQYPQGDITVPPSARMPKGGFYFDSIIRQEPIDDTKLNPDDNLQEFGPLSDEDLRYYQKKATFLFENTNRAIVGGIPGTAFGDIALVPAPFLKHPKGIRDIEEWYISTITRRNYIKEVFSKQSEVAIKNLQCYYHAVGNKIQLIWMDGTDLAAQNTLFCSPDTYPELYLPYAKKLNDWVHTHTKWKTIKHCCGGCEPLIEGFIQAGYDILNPIQCSAKGMKPETLVKKYGGRIVFWGGGVDTQQILPFGQPEQVRQQVRERIKIFSHTNGFVFAAIHNIQCNTPVANVLAMFDAIRKIHT